MSDVRFRPVADGRISRKQSFVVLLDHPVRAQQNLIGNFDAERFRVF